MDSDRNNRNQQLEEVESKHGLILILFIVLGLPIMAILVRFLSQ